MSDVRQVFLVLTLHRRVLQWDSFSQVEFDAFQVQLREHGLSAIFGNERMCAVEPKSKGGTGHIEFWLKIRGDWVQLFLEMRSEEIFILHDVKWKPD
jgi:hypothetical protein